MRIKITELERLVLKALRTQYPQKDSQLIKDVVLFGELAGKPSHGLLRLLKGNYGAFTDTTTGRPELIKKTKVSTLIKSNGNTGMLIGPLATLEVIRLAKKNGIGIVGTQGSFNTTGSLSYYAEKIAKEDLIGIIFTHASAMVAPFSSKKALFGTNPIAFGIPSTPYPIIFDMATSAITFGAIANHKLRNKQLPDNVAIDKIGKITVDPEKAMEGAILAFDNSYKGSGLAMMVEILAGVWTGSSFADAHTEDGWGNLYLALSPDLLSDVSTLKKNSKELINILKKAETRDGKNMRIPGENTLAIRDENLKKGEIEVDISLLERIKKI